MFKRNRKAKKVVRKSNVKAKYSNTSMLKGIRRGAQLVRDVAYLKAQLNAEKKQTTQVALNYDVGQVSANGNAYYTTDLTPIVSQGITGQTRNGNSIKVHSMVIKGQVFQMQNNHHQGKLKMMVLLNKGTPISSWSGANVGDIFQSNVVNTLIDFNSNRALDTFKNWRVLASRIITINPDNYQGVQNWKDFVIPLKFKNYHIKYDDTNTDVIRNGQIVLVVVSDSGNISSSTTSTVANIPVTGINSGFKVASYYQTWYYDN